MTLTELEERETRRVAEELRQKGYRVVLAPHASDIPAFLGEFVPDLLAFREGDNLVVEVKGASVKNLERVVESIEREPGWTFVLVVPPLSGTEADEIGFEEPSEIRKRLDDPAKLYADGQKVAAILLAWAVFEAAARRRVAVDGSDPARALGAEGLVRRLIHLGYLEQRAVEELRHVVRARNRAAHGDLGVGVDLEDLALLKRVTEELLHPPEAA